jgi:hypothetical protein
MIATSRAGDGERQAQIDVRACDVRVDGFRYEQRRGQRKPPL